MGNIVETIGKDVLKGIEYPFEKIVLVAKVLDTVIVDQPELKATLTTLIGKGVTISTHLAANVVEKGLNLPDDAITLGLIEEFFTYLKNTLVPLVVTIYGEIASDIK